MPGKTGTRSWPFGGVDGVLEIDHHAVRRGRGLGKALWPDRRHVQPGGRMLPDGTVRQQDLRSTGRNAHLITPLVRSSAMVTGS